MRSPPPSWKRGLSCWALVVTLLGSRLAAAECTKDTECKGDRICEQGVCVNPGPVGVPPSGLAPPLVAAPPVVASPEAAPTDAGAPVEVDAGMSLAPVPIVLETDAGPPPASAVDAGEPAAPLPVTYLGTVLGPTIPTLEVRVDGFFGFDSAVGGGGVMAGIHLGATTWLGQSRYGLYYLGGAELGALFSQNVVTPPLSLSLELGLALQLAGEHRDGTSLSFAWAPRYLDNFAGGDVGSLLGLEVALREGNFKVPLWFLRTRDQTTFLGLGVGYGF